MQDSLEEQARRFATEAHASAGQRRKYTDEPYIVHPAAVVELVRSVSHDDALLAAAWLHDTVEDTATTQSDIETHFGTRVASLVEMLTNSAPAGQKIGRPVNWRTSAIQPAPVLRHKPSNWLTSSITPARLCVLIPTLRGSTLLKSRYRLSC